MNRLELPRDIDVLAPASPEGRVILGREATVFVADLVRAFRARVAERLAARVASRSRALGFLEETEHVRAGDWTVAPLPSDQF